MLNYVWNALKIDTDKEKNPQGTKNEINHNCWPLP